MEEKQTRSRSFAELFDSRANGLNFLRLLLAVGVLVWHAFPLSGNNVEFAPLRQLLGSVFVDAFFAISGYLIVRSWMRRPDWRAYLRARSLRIFPAYWISLIVTAVVIAPIATGAFGTANLEYILNNSFLWAVQYDIAGSPSSVPFPGVWNGSMWTLAWEFICYLGVMALGLLGAFRWKHTIPLVFAITVAMLAASAFDLVGNWYFGTAARFGVMFMAGAMVWRYQGRLKVSSLNLLAAGVLIASLWLPDYRLIAAFPIAYLVLSAGAMLKRPVFRFDNDLSYGFYIYSFPVQQAIAVTGLWSLGVPAFALLGVIATLPLAALSWFLIEKPVMKLKRRRPPRSLMVAEAPPSMLIEKTGQTRSD